MSELPPGWEVTRLGDVARWSSGGTPRSGTPEFYGGDIPWVVTGDLTDGPVHATTQTLTKLGLAKSSAKLVPAGTVLVAMYGASIGRVGVAKVPLATNQAIANAQVHANAVSPEYILYYLLSQRHALAAAGKGAAQPNIGQGVLKQWPIPVAPRFEQRRIVAAIEEQFSRLDAGVVALDRVRQNLKQMRAAVLQHAIMDPPDGPHPIVRLGDVLREPLRNGHSAKSDPNGQVPVFTLTAVTVGDFSDCNIKMTAADPKRVRSLWIQPGDLLIERSNTPELVGTARLYRGRPNVAIYPDLVIRARVESGINAEYAELVLQAPQSRRYFQRRAQGISGTMPKIDQRTIEDLTFVLPSLDVQARVLSEVQCQIGAIASVDAALSVLDRRSRSLRRSVLISAFSGKLVPQDPNDEPASVLQQCIASDTTSSDGADLTDASKPRTLRPRVPA